MEKSFLLAEKAGRLLGECLGGAVVKTSSNADVAADFLNFCMTDAEAQKIFSNYGFELAG